MFRGARKSTWLNIIIPMMLMARGEMKFMVLIGQNKEFAWRFLGSIQAQGDDSRKANKQERIEAVSVKWETGRVYYNSNEESDPDMLVGIEQTTAFEKGSSAHDDFPDCCEGGIAKIEKLALNSFNANKRSQMSMGRRDKGKYSH